MGYCSMNNLNHSITINIIEILRTKISKCLFLYTYFRRLKIIIYVKKCYKNLSSCFTKAFIILDNINLITMKAYDVPFVNYNKSCRYASSVIPFSQAVYLKILPRQQKILNYCFIKFFYWATKFIFIICGFKISFRQQKIF